MAKKCPLGTKPVTVTRETTTYTRCQPTDIGVKGRKAAYKEPRGYGCVGPQGPPYKTVGDNKDYAPLFNQITTNIQEQPKDARCFLRQGTNLFNGMIATMKLGGMSQAKKKAALQKTKVGQGNLTAYCKVIDTYRSVTGTTRSKKSAYCN